MSVTRGPIGQLARITATTEGGHRAHFDLRDGKTGSFSDTSSVYSVGDVVLITDETADEPARIRKVPRAAWPDVLWVGVVKLKLPDITIIDSGGRFRTVPTVTTPDYETGNTVQAGERRRRHSGTF